MKDCDTIPATLLPKNFTTPFFFHLVPVCPLPTSIHPPLASGQRPDIQMPEGECTRSTLSCPPGLPGNQSVKVFKSLSTSGTTSARPTTPSPLAGQPNAPSIRAWMSQQ
eukprot:3740728-Rhodomonas_salina.1